MLRLIDGPVEGTYLCQRAPLYLRGVIDLKTQEKDVLDQLDDEPESTENVFVYKRQGEAGWMHLLMSPRSKSGFYATGEYKLLDDIDGNILRETSSWRKWVALHIQGNINIETGEIIQ